MLSLLSTLEEGSEDDEDDDKVFIQVRDVFHDFQSVNVVSMSLEIAECLSMILAEITSNGQEEMRDMHVMLSCFFNYDKVVLQPGGVMFRSNGFFISDFMCSREIEDDGCSWQALKQAAKMWNFKLLRMALAKEKDDKKELHALRSFKLISKSSIYLELKHQNKVSLVLMKVENGVIQSHGVKLPDEFISEGGLLLVHVSEAMVFAREEGDDNNGGGSCLPQEIVDDIEDGRMKGNKDVLFARKPKEFAAVGERFENSNRSLWKEKSGPCCCLKKREITKRRAVKNDDGRECSFSLLLIHVDNPGTTSMKLVQQVHGYYSEVLAFKLKGPLDHVDLDDFGNQGTVHVPQGRTNFEFAKKHDSCLIGIEDPMDQNAKILSWMDIKEKGNLTFSLFNFPAYFKDERLLHVQKDLLTMLEQKYEGILLHGPLVTYTVVINHVAVFKSPKSMSECLGLRVTSQGSLCDMPPDFKEKLMLPSRLHELADFLLKATFGQAVYPLDKCIGVVNGDGFFPMQKDGHSYVFSDRFHDKGESALIGRDDAWFSYGPCGFASMDNAFFHPNKNAMLTSDCTGVQRAYDPDGNVPFLAKVLLNKTYSFNGLYSVSSCFQSLRDMSCKRAVLTSLVIVKDHFNKVL